MDSVQRFLSQSINTNSSLTADQIATVSNQIVSAIHQIIVNGAALVSYTQNFTAVVSLDPPPPPHPKKTGQYEYRANSSLVLTTDSRPCDTHEPTGEPESLWGKIDPRSFGDRAYRGRPPELDEKLEKAKNKKKKKDHDALSRNNPPCASQRNYPPCASLQL